MSTPFVNVDFPENGQRFTSSPLVASGECSLDVIVSGKLTREASGGRPRKEVRGLLVSFCPVPPGAPDKKSWILLFDFEADKDGKYTLTVSDEWTGEVLATVFDLSIGPKGMRPLDPVIVVPPPPANPLPRGFTSQVRSAIKTPTPTLTLDHVASFSPVLQAGPVGTETFSWYFSCQVQGWDGHAATLSATQGSGNLGTVPGLTFQPGV
jgi:hypothetical protein